MQTLAMAESDMQPARCEGDVMDTISQLRALARLPRVLMDGHAESICNTAADEIGRLIGDCHRAQREVDAMRKEAEKWASMGWRERTDQDAARADGANEAAEAILAALDEVRKCKP